MPLRRSALVALAFLLVCCGLRAQVPPATGYFGRLEGEYYTAPGNIYRFPIPIMPQFGGQVQDTENVVTFDDPLGLHLSIASFPLDLSQKWEWETRGAREYLAYFHTTFVLADFLQRYPDAHDESSIFVPDLYNGTLIVFSLLPGGSAFEERSSVLGTPVREPAVAKRGTLLFVRDGRIFVLSLELAERVTQRATFHLKPEEENALLRDRLITHARRLEFPRPAGARPQP
jgi:hypothetical protein